MSTNPSVQLDVRNNPARPGDGYTTSQNNGNYSYRYTGGTESANDGTVVEHGRAGGADVITIDLVCAPQYSIQSITFKNDSEHQLIASVATPRRAMITDVNTANEFAEYIVNVRDGATGTVFECDPMIRNEPN